MFRLFKKRKKDTELDSKRIEAKALEAQESLEQAVEEVTETIETAIDTSATDTQASDALADVKAVVPVDVDVDAAVEAEVTDSVADSMSEQPSTEAAPGAKQKSWRERLNDTKFARQINSLIVSQSQVDDDFLDELETILLSADVGINTVESLLEPIRKNVRNGLIANKNELFDALKTHMLAILSPVAQPLNIEENQPFVILVVGINGAGKTTTIGKMARRYLDERKSLWLAAGDTFRAAAVEQLKVWGERNQVPVSAQGTGSDAASVIFDAVQGAKAKSTDVVIADTAGRLHTQSGLMDELAKIKRVMSKLDIDAPHEVLMVIDGTTGQNAMNQVKAFHEAIGLTGIAITKLDGSAKGGIVFALAKEFGLPIRYVGLGEGLHDLRVFDAHHYVDALLPTELA